MRKKKPKAHVKFKKENGFFCLTFNKPITLKINQSRANEKLLYILLRCLYYVTGEQVLSFEEIADMFGLKDRRNIENYWREFKNYGYDFLAYLSRKVELSKYIDIIQNIVIDNPFLNMTECYNYFKLKFPNVEMSITTFRKYLSQIDTYQVLKTIHKTLAKNGNEWDKDYLITYLAENIDNSVVKKKIEDMSSIKSEQPLNVTKSKLNLSSRNKSFLVKFMVGLGLTYYSIAFLLGLSKSYVKDLVHQEPYFNELLLTSIDKYSGRICVDEKYVKYKGVFYYVFSAVDEVTGFPLLVKLFSEKTAQSWQVFFTIFKRHYTKPTLIVSDGCQSLNSGRVAVFPNVRHQFCKFHKMKNLMKKFYENEKDPIIIKKLTEKLKQVFDRDTGGARRKALLELETMLPESLKKYFEVHFKKQWKDLTQSLTSNAAERWNRKIKKIVSGKYGLKSPETIMRLINCLWFKEIIVNGKNHINQESTISKIYITEICQELIPKNNLERYFDSRSA